MQENWEKSIEFVLREEGGANGELVPNDRGGYTKFGISSANNPDLNVPGLTLDQAKEVYRERYWNACRCDELPPSLDMVVFDACVNQGEGAAKRMLQICLGVTVDGIIGDKTIAAAFKAGSLTVRQLLAQRMARYARTLMKDPTQESFIETWSGRLMRLAEVTL